MESTGVMHEIRDLLAQGMSSRQAIDKGYAPGTVYKVQRQFRSQASRRSDTEPALEQSPAILNQIDQNVELPLAQNNEVESEDSRLKGLLRQRAAEIEVLKQENGKGKASFAELVRQAEVLKQERDQARDSITELRVQAETLTRARNTTEIDAANLRAALQAAQQENSDLKAYLAHKNCGWKEDFFRYINERRGGNRCTGIGSNSRCVVNTLPQTYTCRR